jgi:hypothetical protein
MLARLGRHDPVVEAARHRAIVDQPGARRRIRGERRAMRRAYDVAARSVAEEDAMTRRHRPVPLATARAVLAIVTVAPTARARIAAAIRTVEN